MACVGVGFTPVVAPTVDTKGKFGVETRLELSFAAGGPHARFFFSEGTGYGFSEDYGHHLEQVVAVGAEIGEYGPEQPLMGHVAGAFALRAGGAGLALGGHLLLDLFGMVAESKRFRHEFLLGPRLEAGVAHVDAAPTDSRAGGVRGIFSLGLAMRLILFGGSPAYADRREPPPLPPSFETTTPVQPVAP